MGQAAHTVTGGLKHTAQVYEGLRNTVALVPRSELRQKKDGAQRLPETGWGLSAESPGGLRKVQNNPAPSC